MSRSDLQPWGLGLVLAVGVAALYAPAVGFGFLLTDDTMYVAANPWVKSGLTWAGVEWAFTTFEASNWHPTTWLSLMLDAELFGPEPAGFHRTNVALHALAAVLAFAALRAATGRTGLAAFVAGVFAVHPAHVETVAWIPERKHLLAGACGLAALLAYVRYAQRGGALRYAAVFGLTAVGMLAKPVLVTWPCVLLLLDVWPLARWCPGGLDGRAGVAPEVQRARAASPGRLLLEKAPLLALSLGVSLATLAAQGPAMGVAAGVSLGARLENAVVSVARYLARYVWPRELGFLDPLPALRGESWGISLWLGSLALLAAIALFAALRLRRAPFVAVGAAWFLGVLVPVLGLLQVGTQATADRYTYLPYLGVSLALAWSVDAAVRTSAPAVRAATIAAAVVFLAGLGVRTSLQLPVWRSSEALFEHALRMAPDEPEALVALANSYLVRGRAADATPLVRRALERDPRNGPALETLAILLASEGNLARAVQAQRDALAVSPSRPRPWLQLGKLLQASGRAQEAIDAYEASLSRRVSPRASDAWRPSGASAGSRSSEAQRAKPCLTSNACWQRPPAIAAPCAGGPTPCSRPATRRVPWCWPGRPSRSAARIRRPARSRSARSRPWVSSSKLPPRCVRCWSATRVTRWHPGPASASRASRANARPDPVPQKKGLPGFPSSPFDSFDSLEPEGPMESWSHDPSRSSGAERAIPGTPCRRPGHRRRRGAAAEWSPGCRPRPGCRSRRRRPG
jgi:tetratricopeptide (TPR) repeat protein